VEDGARREQAILDAFSVTEDVDDIDARHTRNAVTGPWTAE
jgi:hypothetical protein